MAGFGGSATRKPVRVFISYSHDSDEHIEAVHNLWTFLRSQGIDARLDRPAAERRQEWTAWMVEQVRDAHFVLVVASPGYKRRSDGYATSDDGRGVQFEARLIREHFYRDQDASLERFLPVLLPGVTVESIPDFLSPVASMHYQVTSLTIGGCETLLRVLTSQPYEVEPPLGSVPILAPRVITQHPALSKTIDIIPSSGQEAQVKSMRQRQAPSWSSTTRGVPSITIPPRPIYFSPREDLLAQARASLLETSRTDSARMVGLAGMGGVGKSVLARELARDEQISRAYPDGIVWLELGHTPDLLTRQAQLAELFGDPRPPFDEQQGLANLNALFADKARLVILDNAWKRDHLRAFGLRESKSALLVTTRNRDILDRSATIHDIGPLSEESARQLLAAWACPDQDTLPPEAEDVAQECGGLPLALAIIGGMVADELPWDHVRERLRRADLHKLEINLDDYGGDYKDLLRVLDASVSDLPPKQRARYLELAVFDGRGDVPVEMVERLWLRAGLDDLDIQELIVRLARRSLLQRDKAARTLTLHDLQFDYARHTLGKQRLQALHARMAAIIMDGWGGLLNNLPNLLDGPIRSREQHYGILQLVAHLKEADQYEEIHRLLNVSSPTSTVPGRQGRIENSWYVAHDRIGKIAAYVGDVGLAWNAAKTASDSAAENGRPPASIGREVRYSLVTASIASIAASIPPQLLVALVQNRHWTVEQGFAYARQIPIAQVKARTLVQLLSLLNSVTTVADCSIAGIDVGPGTAGATSTDIPSVGELEPWTVEITAEALAVARSIEDTSSRARILSTLGPVLREPDRTAVVSQAWDAVCAISPGQPQAKALEELVVGNRLPEALHSQAVAAARAVNDAGLRASILTALVAQLHGRDRTAAIKDAQDAISTISQPETRAAALAALIPELRKPRRTAVISQTWDTIRAIPRSYSRARVLVALAPQLPGPDRAIAINDAKTAIRTISQPEDRATALTALIPQLRGRDRIVAVKDAQDAISAISHRGTRAAALTALIPYLLARRKVAVIKDAQAIIRTISQPEDRVTALTALIPQLPEPYRAAAVADAHDTIRAIGHPEARATALTRLALQLSEHDRAVMLAQALSEARAINDARQRAVTFTILAPQLPEWDSPMAEQYGRGVLDSALTDARASADPSSRAITLAILASLMPEADGSSVVRDALKEAAYGVVDAGDRAAVLTALAAEIPEPAHSNIIDEACAAACEIRSPDQRAAALNVLVSKVPEAIERQALRVAKAIDATYMRSRVLADTLKFPRLETEDRLTILDKVLTAHATGEAASPTVISGLKAFSRLPRRKRLAIIESSRNVLDALHELHSRAAALALMTSANMRLPTEMKVTSDAAKAIANACSRIGDLRILTSELPESLQDEVLATVQAINNARSWIEGNPAAPRLLESDDFVAFEAALINESAFQNSLLALTSSISGYHRTALLCNARDAARAIREPSTRATALMALIPHLPEAEQTETLDQALAAAKLIDDIASRAYILEKVAEHSLAGHVLPWRQYWRSVVEDSAAQGRTVLISDLSALSTVIFRLGGSEALRESIHGLLDVGRWWP